MARHNKVVWGVVPDLGLGPYLESCYPATQMAISLARSTKVAQPATKVAQKMPEIKSVRHNSKSKRYRADDSQNQR